MDRVKDCKSSYRTVMALLFTAIGMLMADLKERMLAQSGSGIEEILYSQPGLH